MKLLVFEDLVREVTLSEGCEAVSKHGGKDSGKWAAWWLWQWA